MAIALKYYASHAVSKSNKAANTIDLYLDYACPFSAKLYKKWYTEVFPLLESRYKGQLQIVFRNYVQPWHPVSTLLHESALAVAALQPHLFLEFSYTLFDHITEFYDTETAELGRNALYSLIYDVAVKDQEYSKEIPREEFLEYLTIKPSNKGEEPSNAGNKVTNNLKYFTKVGRQNGIHVTPTVLVNGFPDGSIESSTPVEEVLKKLDALET
jgi:protein-disulfide isomerase